MSSYQLSYPQVGLTRFHSLWSAAQWGNAYSMLLPLSLTELSYVAYTSFLWYQGVLWRYAPDVISCQFLTPFFKYLNGKSGYRPFFFAKARTAKLQSLNLYTRRHRRVSKIGGVHSFLSHSLFSTRPRSQKYSKSGYVRHYFFRDSLREFMNGQLRMRTPLYPLKDNKLTITESKIIRNLKLRKRRMNLTTFWMRRQSFLRILLTLSKRVKVTLKRSTGMDKFYSFIRGTTRPPYSTKRRRHLLPRQLIWLNSPTRIVYPNHRAAKTTLFRASCFGYKRNFKKRSLQYFNTLNRDRPFKRGWVSRNPSQRLKTFPFTTLTTLPSLRFRFRIFPFLSAGDNIGNYSRRQRRSFAKSRRLQLLLSRWSIHGGRRARSLAFLRLRQTVKWKPRRRREGKALKRRTFRRRRLKRGSRTLSKAVQRWSLKGHKALYFLPKLANSAKPLKEGMNLKLNHSTSQFQASPTSLKVRTFVLEILEDLSNFSETPSLILPLLSKFKTSWKPRKGVKGSGTRLRSKSALRRLKNVRRLKRSLNGLQSARRHALTRASWAPLRDLSRSLTYRAFLKKGVRAGRWVLARRLSRLTWEKSLSRKLHRASLSKPYWYASYLRMLKSVKIYLAFTGGRRKARRMVRVFFRSAHTFSAPKNPRRPVILRYRRRGKKRTDVSFRVGLGTLVPVRWVSRATQGHPIRWTKADSLKAFIRRMRWRRARQRKIAKANKTIRRLKVSGHPVKGTSKPVKTLPKPVRGSLKSRMSSRRRLKSCSKRPHFDRRQLLRRKAFSVLVTPLRESAYLRYTQLVQTVFKDFRGYDPSEVLPKLKGFVRRPVWYTKGYFRNKSRFVGVGVRGFVAVCAGWINRLQVSTVKWAKSLSLRALVNLLRLPGRPVMRLKTNVRRELKWRSSINATTTVFTRFSARLLLKAIPIGAHKISQPYYLHSKYRASFILSNCGFLFIDSMDSISKVINVTGAIRARIWKLRLSFFYKNEIKRFYLQRPGRMQVLNLFQNSARGYHFPRFGFSIFRFRNLALGTSMRWPSEGGVQSQELNESHRKSFIKYQTNDYLFEEQSLYSYSGELHIKRIRFKPGYSRIWRRAREALNYSLQYHFRYQHRLTRVLAKLRWSRSATSFYFRELVLIRLVQNSRFVYDRHSSRLLILEGLIYLNGCLTLNPDVRIFVGDIVQVVISLNYYIIYRWLTNWYFQHTLKLTKYIQYRSNKSRYDLSKQKSSNYPDWLFRSIGRHYDIPKYLEVDFFTLSSFMIYDPIQSLDQSFVTLLENRERIYDMYNWKFIN